MKSKFLINLKSVICDRNKNNNFKLENFPKISFRECVKTIMPNVFNKYTFKLSHFNVFFHHNSLIDKSIKTN